MRSMIDQLFAELGIAPRVAMEADDTEAMKKLVETGLGYSFLPEFALHGGPRFFHVMRVRGKRLARTQALAMARSDYRRPLTDSIAQFLYQILVKQNGPV
jgi:DNA-binding transcriptional LysR family regulator